ncbi:MAG: hypothetical protein JNL54_04160 [Kineosporiaceae bacterium]|nr:hypothetical protein [Kineosporiaceae bacterium]
MARRGPDDASPSAPLGAGLSRGERFRLVRAGRRDGRRRRPRLGAEPLPLTTPTREAIMDGRDLALQRIWADHVGRTSRIVAAADELVARLGVLRALAERARHDLQAVDGVPLATVLAERRFGEERADDLLVRRRRQRDHDRRTTAAADRLARAEAAVAADEAELARLVVARAADLRWTVQQGRNTVRIALSQRGVYDAALVARHPHGHLVRAALDATAPPLPGWLAAASPLPDPHEDDPGEDR